MHGSDINHGVKQTEIGVIHHTAAGDLQLYLQQSAVTHLDQSLLLYFTVETKKQ